MPITIAALANPIHDDFYTVIGSGIPTDAVFKFTTAVGAINVPASFTRPQLGFLERLPTTIPPGPADLQLTSASAGTSNTLAVTVSAGPQDVVKTLQPGAAKPHPYTMAFVANPGIEGTMGGFTPDPVLTNRAGFQTVVRHALENLFGVTEDLLTNGGRDAQFRLITIFDTTRPANAANSLAHEIPASTTMETRRAVLAPFLASYGLQADMVFVVHGSTTHTRASAWFTSDDPALASTAFNYDGTARVHGHFPRIPGSAAIPLGVDPHGMTIIHEFGHGASDFANGKVMDLYNDGGSGQGFLVNKKFRAVAGSPIPGAFATYNGVSFNSDSTRDGLGYDATWRSFHPELIDPTNPNLMDNYWLAADPKQCRFDRLTYAWYTDRLNAKLGR